MDKLIIAVYTLLFMYAKKMEDMYFSCQSYLASKVSTLVHNSDETGSSSLLDSLILTY